MNDAPRVEVLPIEQGATTDLQNVNKHTARGGALLENSLRKRGAFRSIASAGKGAEIPVTYAGNYTLEKAVEAGFKEIVNVHVRGDQLVNVVRDDVAPGSAEAIALGLEDNESGAKSYNSDIDILAALAAGDNAILAQLRKEDKVFGGMLEGMGLKDEAQDAEPEFDRAAEVLEKWQVKTGVLWTIGEHRLLCGDSTKREDVERVMGGEKAMLMATDPPYGVDYDNSERPNPGVAKPRVAKPRVANDDLTGGPEMQAFLESMLQAALPSMEKHAAFYFWHPMLTQGTYVAAAAAAGILIHRQIIWVKPVLLLGRGDYHWRHELCFYGWVKGNRPPFYGARNQDTIWEVGSVTQAERKEMGHATPKPIELWDKPISNHTKFGEVCFEPFTGSGAQFVACQNYSRKCYGLELEPKFCACVLERMSQAFPGIPISRVE